MLKKITTNAAKALAALSFAVSLSVSAAPIKTDIVFVIDESGSMSNVQSNLRDNIGLFASILSNGGVDANYGLVGYGGSYNGAARMLTDLTDATSFAIAAGSLIASGSDEDAFDAVAFALNSLPALPSSFSYRGDAIKNVIIATDEPDRNGALDFADADAILKANNALFNAVLTGNNTIASLGDLATGNGGAVFDLNLLGSNNNQVVIDFVAAFANAKLQETLAFCVRFPNDPACIGVVNAPVPPLAALFGIAFVGMLMRKKSII